MSHRIAVSPSPRSVRARARAAALLCLGLAPALAWPAAAQTVVPDRCVCAAASRDDDEDRDRPWWLLGFLPLVGVPLGWGGGAPGAAGPMGAATPAGVPIAPLATGVAPGAIGPATAAPQAAPAPAPAGTYTSQSAGLVAPDTATQRPTLGAAAVALLLLGAALRRMARRARMHEVAARLLGSIAGTRYARAARRRRRAPTLLRALFGAWHAPGVSGAVTAAGVGCLAVLAFGVAQGAVAAWHVRENWAKPSADAALVPTGGLEIAAVARLEIPAIGLTRLVGDGVDSRTLAAGPGHMPETVAPGVGGLSVISAHRDLDFRGLGALAVGDTVVTTTRARRTVWRVVERTVVPKDSAALRDTAGEPRLALTTCWPIRYFGDAPERLLVFAEPVHDDPAPAEPVRLASR